MIAFVDGRIVLQLVVIGDDGADAERIAALSELSQNVDGGS